MTLRAALRASNLHKARLQQGSSITWVEKNRQGFTMKYDGSEEKRFTTYEALYLSLEEVSDTWEPMQR